MPAVIRFAILISIATTCVGFALPKAVVGQISKIDWQPDPLAAAQQAGVENKLVMLHFTAPWCGPCQNQKRFVFSDPSVGRAVHQAVIPVKVNIDSNRPLARELGVSSIPYDVFLSSTGEVITKRNSPQDAQNFIRMISQLRAPSVAPPSEAVTKLGELKRTFDPMNLPANQRSTFSASGPGNRTFGVSKEAIELARKSNYSNQLGFRNDRPHHFAGKRKPAPAAQDVHAALKALAQSTQAPDSPKATSKSFNLPERSATQSLSDNSSPQTNPQVEPQRAREMFERQAFLNRERPQIQIPEAPKNVKPVRILNENFLARNDMAEFRSAGIPGVEVSNMIDPRTGKVVPDAHTKGQSIARFKVDTPPALSPIDARIVPTVKQRVQPVSQASAVASVTQTTRSTMTQVQREVNEDSQPYNSFNDQPADDFCLQGKCPVALMKQGKWVDGDTRWGIVHRDRTYLFSSKEYYDLFRQRPDDFSPVLAGYDPVTLHESGEFIDGLEQHGVFMEKSQHQQIVLFRSDENRKKFQANPSIYMRAVRKAFYTASRRDAAQSENDAVSR